ncbi:MAG TPA: hypothetical protein VIC33_11265 [Vicinamibacterales bacterium]|jgi:drug/metabolite transporter (DMT)-like permease
MDLKHQNRLFIVLVVASNTVGNLLLAIGLARLPDFSLDAPLRYPEAFLSSGWILGGIALMTLWMLAQLSMYTWADLTYVLPVTASAYIFTAILGRLVLHEAVSPLRWVGVVIISLGVLLVAETPLQTQISPGSGGQP